MNANVAVFWAVVGLLILALRLAPANPISRAAFTWLGPARTVGEKWSTYQFRWAAYSASWLIQCLFLFSALWLISKIWPTTTATTWWQIFLFALSIAGGGATVAAIGFVLKGAKARYIGPDDTPKSPVDSTSRV